MGTAEDKDDEMSLDPPAVTSSCSGSPSPNGSLPEMSMMDLSARMQQSINCLEAASQAVRLRIASKEQSDKSTAASYERHVNSYTVWWDAYQATVVGADPTQVAIPAIPVTAAKATMFLEYTSTRPKVSCVAYSYLHNVFDVPFISASTEAQKRSLALLWGSVSSSRPYQPLRVTDSSTNTFTNISPSRKWVSVLMPASATSSLLQSTMNRSVLNQPRC